MMTRFTISQMAAGAVLLGSLVACGSSTDGGAAAEGDCDPVSVALPTSTEAQVLTYATKTGKVSGDMNVEIEPSFLEVPALIQATGTDQYDLLQTSLIGFAGAVDKGAPLLGVAPVASRGPGQDKIVVAADSDIRSPSDLGGETMAVGSVGGTVTTLMRMGLGKTTGLDTDTQGGDVKFVELAPTAALNGLQRNNVGAAFLYQQPWWQIQDDPKFRELADVQEIFQEAYGFRPMISMLITTKTINDTKHDCLVAASKLLLSSWNYAKDNSTEVAEALTESENVAVDDLKALIDGGYEYGGSQDQALLDRAQDTLEAADDAGELTVPVPDLADYYIEW